MIMLPYVLDCSSMSIATCLFDLFWQFLIWIDSSGKYLRRFLELKHTKTMPISSISIKNAWQGRPCSYSIPWSRCSLIVIGSKGSHQEKATKSNASHRLLTHPRNISKFPKIPPRFLNLLFDIPSSDRRRIRTRWNGAGRECIDQLLQQRIHTRWAPTSYFYEVEIPL